MRYICILFILVLLVSHVIVPSAAADTRYVGDELVITLRQGKSNQHKILKTLKTGTAVEVLEEDELYLKVKTADGVEGYVLRQYMTPETPKILRIEKLESLNNSLQKKIRTLEDAKGDLEMELKTLEANYKENFGAITAKSADMEKNLDQALNNERIMAEKYDTLLAQAENVVEIAAEREELLQKNKKLEAEVAALLQRNDKLADSRMIKWFLAGGGVLFFGWIIGKISRKKRSRY